MRALWLASWYPDKLDIYNGDFIQRHAIAASSFCNIDVFHVHPDTEKKIHQTEISTFKRNDQLSETIVLLPFASGLFSAFYNQYNYFNVYKSILENYIQENGLPDIVHLHVPVKAGLLALYLKRKYQLPFVVTEHWAIYNTVAPNNFNSRHLWFKQLTRRVFSKASAFFPVSEELGEAVNKMVTTVPFSVIRNAVNTAYFRHQERDRADENNFHFLHASTMGYQKNAEGILRVFSRLHSKHPHVRLLMIGGLRPDLEAQYSTLVEASALVFGGIVSYELVAQYMQQADAFVLFSRHENMPCVIQESLCCGLPVISTKVGGIPEVISDNNGILINMDEDELFLAMEKMLTTSSNYKKEEIAAKASSLYSYESIGHQIVDNYRKILAKNQA